MDNIKEDIDKVAKIWEDKYGAYLTNDYTTEDFKVLSYNCLVVGNYLIEKEIVDKSLMEGNEKYVAAAFEVLLVLFNSENQYNVQYAKLQNPEKFIEYIIPELEKEYLYNRVEKDFSPKSAKQMAAIHVGKQIYKIIHEGKKLCV